jgi:hypothetical protein
MLTSLGDVLEAVVTSNTLHKLGMTAAEVGRCHFTFPHVDALTRSQRLAKASCVAVLPQLAVADARLRGFSLDRADPVFRSPESIKHNPDFWGSRTVWKP